MPATEYKVQQNNTATELRRVVVVYLFIYLSPPLAPHTRFSTAHRNGVIQVGERDRIFHAEDVVKEVEKCGDYPKIRSASLMTRQTGCCSL